MSKTWRLTRTAEASLTGIADWTFSVFGPRQAAAYESDLISHCTQIAAGKAVSRDCRQLVDAALAENLRYVRAGQHFVIFIEDAEQVVIVDFLHARSDLPGKLACLMGVTRSHDR